MNERFRLLADQAQIGIFEDKAFGWSVIAGTDQHLAKFAELIVQECMLQCDTPGSGNTPLSKDFNEGHFMGVYESFHKIRNHFGVKEE